MEREALKQKLHGTTVMVSVDCWSTQDSAACLGLCINNHLWFLADTETANHTGPWLASEVSREIVKIEKELNCEVAGIVSDNASNMESKSSTASLGGGGCQRSQPAPPFPAQHGPSPRVLPQSCGPCT